MVPKIVRGTTLGGDHFSYDRPPQLGIQFPNDVFAGIKGMLSCKRFIIACGDFNTDISDIRKPYTSILNSLYPTTT